MTFFPIPAINLAFGWSHTRIKSVCSDVDTTKPFHNIYAPTLLYWGLWILLDYFLRECLYTHIYYPTLFIDGFASTSLYRFIKITHYIICLRSYYTYTGLHVCRIYSQYCRTYLPMVWTCILINEGSPYTSYLQK